MRVVTALAKQLNGNITPRAVPNGTEFALLVPYDPMATNEYTLAAHELR
jgi:hypothetical protein